MQLSEEQRTDWLRLIRSETVGPRTFRVLINRFGGAGAALEALPDLARRSGRRVKIGSRSEAEKELAAAARMSARFVALGEPDYPKALQGIDTAPPLVVVRGAAAVLARPMVAMVGSRNASAAGLTFAERLSRALGEEGYAIVSGLARGIDARAHKASLRTGTIAVLAGGQDRIYPAEHAGLIDAILDHDGAVLTEMPFGWEPRSRDFPRRNRIVSGLSYGVIVIEAARRSGSLITARFALEQGREVFAVPGSPLDPRAEGTNDLIRQGATLCASAEHVTSVLAPIVATGLVPHRETPERPRADLEEGAHLWDEWAFDEPELLSETPDDEPSTSTETLDGPAKLIALLSTTPTAIDELARQSGMPIRQVQTILFDLELAGRLERHGAGAVSMIGPALP